MPVQNEYGLQSGLYGAAGTEKADKNELAIKTIQGDLCITIMKWDIYIFVPIDSKVVWYRIRVLTQRHIQTNQACALYSFCVVLK